MYGCNMSKVSNRDKILCEGMKVVHERGFAGASVRDIVQAAGVPQGSFSNHFASKEAFGLEILNIYYENRAKVVAQTLNNENIQPLKRIRAFIESTKCSLSENGAKNGCMFGNFSAEIGSQSEVLRKRLVEIFDETRAALSSCLKAAVKAGDLPKNTKCDNLAVFIISLVHGAILLCKVQRSTDPLEAVEQILFSSVLG